jgi:cathepsin E
MLLITSLAAFVVLAKAVPDCPKTVHKSLVSLRLAKNLNSSYGVSGLVERDRARASIFLEQSSTSAPESISSVEVTNAANFYLASVGVGAPPTYCRSC